MNMTPTFTDLTGDSEADAAAGSLNGNEPAVPTEAELLMQMNQMNRANRAISAAIATGPLLLGSVISPRQESEMSGLTCGDSRRGSMSSISLASPARSVSGRRAKGGSVASRPGSSDSDSSLASGRSDTLRELFSLRGELTAIPDNSYHSTLEVSGHGSFKGSSHGSRHGSCGSKNVSSGSLERVRERLERRTGPVEEDYHMFPPPLSSPASSGGMQGAKMRSFLEPFSQPQMPFSQEKLSSGAQSRYGMIPSTPSIEMAPSADSIEDLLGTDPTKQSTTATVELQRSVTLIPAQPDVENREPTESSQEVVLIDSSPEEYSEEMPSSPILTRTSPRMRSFLEPIRQDHQDQIPFSAYTKGTPLPLSSNHTNEPSPFHHQPRAVTPPARQQTADTQPSPPTDNPFHLTPMDGNKDLSLEDVLSLTHLPADLSMDTISIYPTSEPPGILPVDSDDTRGRSMEDMLADLPNDSPLGHGVASKHSRPSTVNSNCLTQSSGSASEDLGHAIRKGMLDGMMFDSDTDHDMDCDTDNTSSERSYVNVRQQGHDNSVMDGMSLTSADSSFHFDNLPSDIQSCNMSTNGNEVDSNSEVATACSDEDITHLEELYSDIFGEEGNAGQENLQIHRGSSGSSDLSSETLSMLGLLKDDRSTQSSVVSFDSTEFLEDDQLDIHGDPTKSKASCSISMHDITTIHEEDEDDIAQEKEDRAAQMDYGCFHTPLINGELHLRRQDLISQGTTNSGGFSSVTDDSYVGCVSFDSLSQGSSPLNARKKWKMDMGNVHQDFTVLAPPPTAGICMATQPFNDESSQFTFESSRASIADFSYDSFSSESVKYMVDILKEEAERRRSKIKERIAMIRESTERVSYTSRYVESRLMNGKGGDETSEGSSSLSL